MTDYTGPSEYEKQLEIVRNQRKEAYETELGNAEEQLDMIYHDIDAWKLAVKAIKDAYPKPAEE